MTRPEWRLPFGANVVESDRTRFRFWAPAQSEVLLKIDGRAPLPMTRSVAGWFEVEAGCGAGTRYQYILQDGVAVPDPASRAQADDVHGASVVTDPYAYAWQQPQWRGRPWHEAVVYELHVGLMGGFAGVTRALPRLSTLGITAVELMPIAEFPGARNWGYDGTLPFAPERSYGTPDDLRKLVDAAHEHGMMIFLDVVYNHFGPDGNYLSLYAPETFRADLSTPWGPAIDFRRDEVRCFFTDNALFWLIEYRFDGLRLDAVHAIAEQDWLDEMAAEVRRIVGRQRQVHLVLENDDNAAGHLSRGFDAQWNDDGHHVLHVLLTGESSGYYGDYADRPAERLARCLQEGFIYQGEPSAHRSGQPRGTPSAALPPTAFVLFLQNHDQIGNRAFGERLTELADPRALEAAIALLLLCPQIPLIFTGEEDASPSPFLFFTDHNARLADAVREGRKREFSSFPQFSDEKLLAALPDPNAVATFEQSRPQPDVVAAARFELYQRLLDIRHREIIPRLKGARAVDAHVLGDASVAASWRMADESVLSIACNLGAGEVEWAMPDGSLLFTGSDSTARSAATGRLAPYSTVAVLGRT
jgi:maltooligosyltrehalose trehalohydrolase